MDNPWAWAALAAIILFVVLLNLSLLSALRRKPGRPGALERGLQAISAVRQASGRQQADLDELRRRVAELKPPDE